MAKSVEHEHAVFHQLRAEGRNIGTVPQSGGRAGLTVAAALEHLARTVAVVGKHVHDANIVAAMQVHGIRHLLTNNGDDCARFAQCITVVPL